jgi:hypothetical protein
MNKTQKRLIGWLFENGNDIFFWGEQPYNKNIKPGLIMSGKILNYPFRVFKEYDGTVWCGIYDETSKGSIVPAFYTMTGLKKWYNKHQGSVIQTKKRYDNLPF